MLVLRGKANKISPVAADASLSSFPLGRDGEQASLTQIKPLVGLPLLLSPTNSDDLEEHGK